MNNLSFSQPRHAFFEEWVCPKRYAMSLFLLTIMWGGSLVMAFVQPGSEAPWLLGGTAAAISYVAIRARNPSFRDAGWKYISSLIAGLSTPMMALHFFAWEWLDTWFGVLAAAFISGISGVAIVNAARMWLDSKVTQPMITDAQRRGIVVENSPETGASGMTKP